MSKPRAPRQKLQPTFQAAVYRSRQRLRALADRAGVPAETALSSLLHDEFVRVTPLVVGRLRLLATLVGHAPDEIFVDPGEGLATAAKGEPTPSGQRTCPPQVADELLRRRPSAGWTSR
jgi:hypothetical protein